MKHMCMIHFIIILKLHLISMDPHTPKCCGNFANGNNINKKNVSIFLYYCTLVQTNPLKNEEDKDH